MFSVGLLFFPSMLLKCMYVYVRAFIHSHGHFIYAFVGPWDDDEEDLDPFTENPNDLLGRTIQFEVMSFFQKKISPGTSD